MSIRFSEGYGTGYYAVPGMRTSKVHIVDLSDKSPMCGAGADPGILEKWKAHYQFCANHLVPEYVTCKLCKAMLSSKTTIEQVRVGMYEEIEELLERYLNEGYPIGFAIKDMEGLIGTVGRQLAYNKGVKP